LLRYGLAVVAGAFVALLAAAPFLGRERGQGPPANNPPDIMQPPATRPPVREPTEVVRLTYGTLGPTRPDDRVLPGEEILVEFTFSGVATDRAGKTDITFAAELTDEEGKKVLELLPVPVKSVLALGGGTFTGEVSFSLPDGFPAGSYNVRVVLNDKLAGKILAGKHPVRVLPPGFGAVGLRFANDRQGKAAAGGNLTVGQRLFLVGDAVGFARKEGRIHVTGSFSIRDSAGNMTIPSPVTIVVDSEVTDESKRVSFDFSLFANRPGEFTVVVELRDVIGQKAATYELPLVVHPPRSVQAPDRER
jgi:hypothetical protein